MSTENNYNHDRDYLMRSEKRPNSAYKRAKRRRRTSRVLSVFAVILGVICWPIGMILLWLRQARLYASTKILLSMITLILCILLYGTLLNLPFEDERVTRIQDTVNTALDSAYDSSLVILDKCIDSLTDAKDLAIEVGASLAEFSAVETAKYIDKGVELSEIALAWADGLIGSILPEESAAPVESASPETTSVPTAAPTATPLPTDAPAATDAPDTTVSPESSAAPDTTGAA